MHTTMKAAIRAAGDTTDDAALKLDYHPTYLRAVLNGAYPISLKLARRFARTYPDWRLHGVALFGAMLDGKIVPFDANKIPVAS